jgi:hypothetical protein
MANLMRKKSIYLDTSIINFLFADDAPEKRDLTKEFFENYVRTKVYDVWISPVVLSEIQETKDDSKRAMLLDFISGYELQVTDIENASNEIQGLARLYIQGGIIPEKKLEDALHVAIATVFEYDILLSWNFRHLANVNKEARIQAVNLQAGYVKPLRLLTPMEVIYDEED